MLKPQDLNLAREAFNRAAVLLIQLEIPYDTVYEAINMARAEGLKVILNPAPAGDLPDEVLENVDILTPNETEAEKLTGIMAGSAEDAGSASNELHRRGVKKVLLTMGAKGAWLSDPENGIQQMLPGFRVQPVDTTAAGDVFNGALAVALNEGKDLPVAVRFAHAAAALSVGRAGAQPSIPAREEVERFLKSNPE